MYFKQENYVSKISMQTIQLLNRSCSTMSFEWMNCSFFLKKNINNSQITLNLTPYHKLQVVHADCEPEEIELTVKMSFERSLMYDPHIGWNWHKSWTIPDINVSLEARSRSHPEIDISLSKNIYAEIYIVKPIISKQYSLCVEDLGLEGNTCFELGNNRCTFSGLKFSATSYNNQGSKFHFLLTVYEKSDEKAESSKILLSRISTPVFVDSRKSAREAELIKLKKLSAYIEPFEIASIHKQFIKKESKKSKGYAEEEIQNNLSGLYNYFGAANIRNKVKHPLFLAIKFCECFSIYYRRDALEQRGVVRFIQNSLFSIYDNINTYRATTRLAAKKIILAVKSENMMGRICQHKKIPEFLEIIQSEQVGCVVELESIPEGFELLRTTPELVAEYESAFNEISKLNSAIYMQKEQELRNQSLPTNKKTPSEANQIIEVTKQRQKLNSTSVSQPGDNLPEEQAVKHEEDDDEDESDSSDSFTNQRPNIALKCEILIDPFRHRPITLGKFLSLNENSDTQREMVLCEKRLLSDIKELSVLNQLLKIEVEEKKNRFRRNPIDFNPLAAH